MNRLNKITGLALLATFGTCQLEVAQAAKWLVQPIHEATDVAGAYYYYTPTGVNNSGVVIGTKGSGAVTGFVTGADGVGYQSLGNLYGTPDINDAGEIAGIGPNGLVFITPPNSLTQNSIALLPGADQNAFNGLSSDGRIIGISGTWVSPKLMSWNRFFFTGPHGSGVTEWFKPGAFISADLKGINNTGRIAATGTLSTTNQATGLSNTHALLTGPNGADYQDLGTLGGENSAAVAVNDNGQVIGNSQVAVGQAAQRAFLTGPNGAAMKDLGDLGGGESTAVGLNNLGQVVGSSLTAPGSDTSAFITGPNGVGMRNLTQEVSLPGSSQLRTALGINDKGQVIAQDYAQAYLLTPIPQLPAGACAVSYKVTYTGFGFFTAQVSVANQGAAAQSDWSVDWQYGFRPLLVATNAKIAFSDTVVTATPTIFNKTIKAQSTLTFTLTGSTKSGKVPLINGLSGNLGGKSCVTTVQ